jgi:hypothetical protein
MAYTKPEQNPWLGKGSLPKASVLVGLFVPVCGAMAFPIAEEEKALIRQIRLFKNREASLKSS